MIKVNLFYLKTTLTISFILTLLLSACGGNIIKPVRYDIIGHSTIRNVTVVLVKSAKSATIANQVKAAIKKRAKEKLKGNNQVDLKVTIDIWQGTNIALAGGKVNRFIGSRTILNGLVDILDTNTGEALGQYKILSEYKEGGLAELKKTRVHYKNLNQVVIDNFAMYTINYLE